MHERHPVEKSPPYHVVIWIIAGLVAAAVVFGLVRRANVPPPQVPPRPPGQKVNQPSAALTKIPFTDVTREAGVTFSHDGGATGEKMLPESGGAGCAFLDYDNDGDPDLLLISGRAWEWNSTDAAAPRKNVLALYRNDAGKFTDVTTETGLAGDFYGQGAAVGDYDADGDDDLVVTALAAIHVYRNDAGKFTDATADSGIKVGETDWPTSAGFLDYDRDGDLDLFVCNYVRWTREVDQAAVRRVPGTGLSYAHPENFEGVQNFLFRNDGGRFSDVSSAAGIHVNDTATGKPLGKGLAATFVDFDGDGWLDIFVANDTVRHFLYRNRGDGSFEEVAAGRGAALNSDGATTSGMSADAAWLRGDDELAIGVGNFAEERTTLFIADRAGGQLRFADQSIEAGIGGPTRDMLTWGLLFDDFDLDGRPDIAQTNGHLEETIAEVQPSQSYAQRGQLFWNNGGDGPRLFTELPAANIGDLAQPAVGRSLASADIDGDGDLDLVITTVGGPPRLLRNDRDNNHHWLRIRLAGPPGNPHGIGATLELRAAGRTQRRTIMPTRSYLSQTEPVATFGLGNALTIESLLVTWPDGSEQTFVAGGVDRLITVQKDQQTFAVLANLGIAQLENGDYQKAIAILQRALAMKPDSIATRRNLARARFLWEQFAAALDELRRLDAESPSAANAYLMGLAALRLANNQQLPYSDAVGHLRRAAALDPDNPTVRYQLAVALSDAGEGDAANEQLLKTVELDPLHGQAQYRLALRLRRADPELAGRYMREYQQVLAQKGGRIDPASLEVCQYTKAEPPEIEPSVEPSIEGPAARFVAADIAAADSEARLPSDLVAVAPLSLNESGRYELVGVTATGRLVTIGFDEAGRASVLTRAEQSLGNIGNDAILLVGNAIRDADQRSTPRNPGEPIVDADHPEFVVVTPSRTWFQRYAGGANFIDLSESSGLAAAAGDVARWIDLEHDGDIDLCVSSPAGVKVWRNNSDGTFAELTNEFGLAAAGPAIDLAAIDLDGANVHTGLVLVGPQRPSPWRSRISGQFIKDSVQDEAPLSPPAPSRVLVDDFTNDGLPDVLLLAPNGRVTLNGRSQQLAAIGVLDDATTIDVDNDGWLDVAIFGRAADASAGFILRNRDGQFAQSAEPLPTPASPRRNGLLAFDIDGDCDTDLLLLDDQGRLHALRNETASGNRQLKLSLYSNVGHPSPIGTRVQVRRDNFAASRWTGRELPIEIGVGPRERIDAVQTLWMNGVARNEIDVPVDCKPLRITILEFRQTTSCPFLYAQIDGRWQFVTDLLGVAPLNVSLARGVPMPPDPDEVVILGSAERLADGATAARLRISTELREVTLLDQVRLLAIDHPPGTTIFSRDRVAMTGVAGKQVIAGRDPIVPRTAIGSDGIDRTDSLAREDGQFADVGRVIPPPVVGFIEPLSIELDFGALADTSDILLALTGWLRFGESSSNIAASQRGDLAVIWPKLEVQDASGQWQPIDVTIGLPAGKTKTIACDLAGKLPPGTRKLRLTSSFEVRWDHIALYHAVPAGELRFSEAGPAAANLAWHGFAKLSAPAADQPTRPDVAQMSDLPDWFSSIEGWCTRYGDVRPLVAEADSRLEIMNAGDATTLEFPADALPPREPNMVRTLALYSQGWVKEGDPNSTSEATVTPFPGSDAPLASDPAGDWQLQYNSRWVPGDRFMPTRRP